MTPGEPILDPRALGRSVRFPEWAPLMPYALVALAVLVIGVLFGALAVGVLSTPERDGLLTSLQQWVVAAANGPVLAGWLPGSVATNLKVLALIYLLGISVAGLPLVPLVLFFRGFVLGFAAALVLPGVHWQNFWSIDLTLVMANCILVPAWAVMGALAMRFSWRLLSGRRKAPALGAVLDEFAGYTVSTVGVAGALAVATIAQAAFVPVLLHLPFVGHP